MLVRFALLLLVALPAFPRTLHWNSIDVDARLGRDGNLRVVETQEMVFDGDWNGAERDFNLRGRQGVDVHRIVRIDGTTEVPLTRGELGEVDRWDFATDDTIRWRSRMPDDPPFANQELTYRLEYTLSNVLLADDGRFRLDHDFGLPDRDGVVKRFTLDLSFDPAWGAQPITITRENQPAGEGVPVEVALTYSGAEPPPGIQRLLPWWVPLLVLTLFAGGVAWIVNRFIAAERAVGRWEPVVARFDDAVLKLQPEVAGAVWDAGVGAPEVAAVLARMTQEGKLTTRADGETLHLRLEVPRRTLSGYERLLIDKLFIDGGTETDTDAIRTHYASTGFDPAEQIREGIETKLEKLAGWKKKVRRFSPAVDATLIGGAFALAAGSALFGENDIAAAAVGVLGTGLFSLFASLAAVHYSKSIAHLRTAVAAPSALMLIASAPLFVFCILARSLGLHAPVLFALMLWTLAMVKLVFDLLRIRDTPEKIAYRKRIAGARQFFVEQLEREKPELRDEWFPYVLAFGLGSNVDRWFRAFGGTTATRSSGMSSSWSSSSSSSSSSPGWTGGGGAFGGAGASGTWAVAAGAMASGVSAPSSSGSGGGGGSFSGGGGGGGW